MIISFDIDNTLIPYANEFEVENRSLLCRFFKAETIRKGTIRLFKELQSRGHIIWIYTTSFRSDFYLKRTFICYGLSPSRIINQRTNQRKLNEHNCHSSKNPNLFGIDLHIDDSKGVELEGEKYGFKTIIIDVNDSGWTKKILARVYTFEAIPDEKNN